MTSATIGLESGVQRRIDRVEFCSWQQEAFVYNEADAYQLYSGAFGSGKSRGVCEKILYLGLKYPGARIGLFRKVGKNIKKTTLHTFEETCPVELIIRHNKADREITLLNGTEIMYLGLDDPQKIGSLELDFAGVDEYVELDEDDHVMLAGRIGRGKTGHPGILFGATNPGVPAHFLHKAFFTDRIGAVYETETADNRFLPKSYKARLSQFVGPYFERFVRGKWITMEGLVYPIFDPIKHIVKPFKIPGDWPKFRCIDFGYRNPFVCIWFALSPDDEMFVYRQLYMSRRTVREHSVTIHGAERVYKIAPGGKKRRYRELIEQTWADHDAEDRATLEEENIDTESAEKAVTTGLQEVSARFADARLFIFANSVIETDLHMVHLGRPTSGQEELQGYALHRSKTGQPDKESPIKVNDHFCDALRYGCMGVKTWSAGAPIGSL